MSPLDLEPEVEVPATLTTMPIAVIESPFAANGAFTEAEHRRYLRRCLKDSLVRGEAPFASHALYPGVLDDDEPDERAWGIAAGLAFVPLAHRHAFYIDFGLSRGMRLALAKYSVKGPLGWADNQARLCFRTLARPDYSFHSLYDCTRFVGTLRHAAL
jgi:hypothetical protein